jgi:hypothetical protein
MIAALVGALLHGACADEGGFDDLTSSNSYKGHESDVDANNFVSVYPNTLGTRLDDCQTCHRGGTFSYESDGEIETTFKNACDYCHLITHPAEDFIEAQPTTYAETLNTYGTAYLEAGRTMEALDGVGSDDSDEDGFDNAKEIADLKYPGDPDSKPGQDVAPAVTFTMEDVQELTAHEQFLLANSHKQQFDDYSEYVGVPVAELLAQAGVDLADSAIQGITVIAPDGYMKDFTVDEIEQTFPDGLFYDGLDVGTLGTECGFVTYPDTLPDGLTDGGPIPGDQLLTMAYERNGLALETSSLDITSGKINGEGPFRVVVPQSTPGSPDRGSMFPTDCNDGWDYDETKDHNAGAMVRGVVAVRVNPLPGGYEDFDHYNGGWAYIDAESLIVYGHGIEGE